MIVKSRIFLNSLPGHWTDSYWEIHLLPRIKRIKSTKPQRNQDSTVQQKLFRISQWVFIHQVEINARLQVRASMMASSCQPLALAACAGHPWAARGHSHRWVWAVGCGLWAVSWAQMRHCGTWNVLQGVLDSVVPFLFPSCSLHIVLNNLNSLQRFTFNC